MEIKTCVLASGSKGNVVYLETPKHKILIDMGTNVKYIIEKLGELNIKPEEIDYIFISHVHSDHISALKQFVKRYQPTICVSQNIFLELPEIEDYDHIHIYEDDFALPDLEVGVIKTSHDTLDSRSFIFTYNNKSVVYITDTGYLNEKYFHKLTNKEVYIFESNHDIEMLQNGKYPRWLKARVYGDSGHLSNQMASFCLTKLMGSKTKKIILHHLSAENNTKECALKAFETALKEANIEFNNIECASQKEKSEVVSI